MQLAVSVPAGLLKRPIIRISPIVEATLLIAGTGSCSCWVRVRVCMRRWVCGFLFPSLLAIPFRLSVDISFDYDLWIEIFIEFWFGLEGESYLKNLTSLEGSPRQQNHWS